MESVTGVDELVEMLTSEDADTRVAALHYAGNLFGPGAIGPLFELLDSDDRTTFLAAQRALGWIVHGNLRPRENEADKEALRQATAEALTPYLDGNHSSRAAQEAMYLLSFCGGADEVPVIAEWLDDANMAQHALYALVRIPDEAALTAMLDALDGADTSLSVELAHAIAQKEGAAARDRLEALADSGDEEVATAAAKALSIREFRVDA